MVEWQRLLSFEFRLIGDSFTHGGPRSGLAKNPKKAHLGLGSTVVKIMSAQEPGCAFGAA